MNYHQDFHYLLKNYGELVGLSGVEATDQGFCALVVDDDVVVQMQLDEKTGSLAFFVNLGKIEEEDRANAYPYILAANVLWVGTAGATLGVDYEGFVMVCYHEPLPGMDGERFAKIIDNLVTVAMDWEENLVSIRQGDAEASGERGEGTQETDVPASGIRI
jgi:hypothetical protein